MMTSYKSLFLVYLVSAIAFVFFVPQTFAATLSGVKDTITTSRPSAASPIDQSSTTPVTADTFVTIYNNGSRYFASDSAKIVRTSTGGQIGNAVTVASQSATLTNIYFTGGLSSATYQKSTDVLVTNITAVHTINFITASAIPSGGHIIITFPGSAANTASPSATTFSFNNMTTSNPTDVIFNGVTCASVSVSAPTIDCTTSGATGASTSITVLIGCTSGTTSCSAQAPRLINPTKTNSAGNRDLWSINLQTQDASNVVIDTGKALIGTIESVQVKASVDNSFTFTITGGFAAGGSVNSGNSTACTTTDTVSSGVSTNTATLVDLGILTTSSLNIHAQRINITTNGLGGYTLTATASGHLINNATGFWIADSTTPAAFPATAPWFGIHACGLDVNTSTWGTAAGNTARGSGSKYGWPTQTTAVTLASDSTGPIDNSIASDGNGIVTVEYAAGIDSTVPAGNYQAYVTYVATPTF